MKKNTFNTIVPIDCHGYRIDKFLQLQINKLSRTRLQALIRDGQVKLNNTTINNPSKKIREGDQIKIDFPTPKETLIKPNKIPLDILYDDNDIIVINKSPLETLSPSFFNHLTMVPSVMSAPIEGIVISLINFFLLISSNSITAYIFSLSLCLMKDIQHFLNLYYMAKEHLQSLF